MNSVGDARGQGREGGEACVAAKRLPDRSFSVPSLLYSRVLQRPLPTAPVPAACHPLRGHAACAETSTYYWSHAHYVVSTCIHVRISKGGYQESKIIFSTTGVEHSVHTLIERLSRTELG
eukprot:363614-Chlamydomonas_euryale.AAC.5